MAEYDFLTPRSSHVLPKKEISKLPRHKPPKKSRKYTYQLTVSREEISTGELLQITAWDVSKRPQIVFIAYIDDERDATYFPASRSWSTATLEYNIELNLHCWQKIDKQNIFIDEASAAVVIDRTGDKYTDPLSQLEGMFVRNRSAATNRRHRNMQERFEAILSQRKPLPYDFYKFLDLHVFHKERYIVYRREKNTIHGYCICCQTGFSIPAKKGMRPGAVITCPNCHRPAKLLSPATRKTNGFCVGSHVTLLNRISDGLLVRCVPVVRHYEFDRIFYSGTYYDQVLAETAEYFIPFADSHDIDIEYVNGVYGYAWRPAKAASFSYTPQYKPGVLYSRNIRNELRNTPWEHSALEIIARRDDLFWMGHDVSKYLNHAKLYPLIERLMKVGLIWLGLAEASNRSVYKWNDNSKAKLHSILGVFREDIPLMARMGVSVEEARLYTLCRRSGFHDIDKFISRLRKICDNRKITSFVVDGINDLRNSFGEKTVMRLLFDYIPGQQGEHGYNTVLRDYADYLSQCHTLELDMSDTANVYPKSLMERHAALSGIVKAKKDMETGQAIIAQWEQKHERFDFIGDGYCVFFAPTQEDIIAEGIIMSHCVGNYTKKVAEGKTNILFVRSSAEPDKSLATAEVRDDGTVVQIRAARNAKPPAEVMKFWETYKKKVLSKLSEAKAELIRVAV